MKRKPSVSHDEAIIRRLRKDSEFAVEYMRAALEEYDKEQDGAQVLLIALRQLAQAQGIAKVAKAAGIEREESIPGVVGARQSAFVHAVCCDQGDWVAAYGGGGFVNYLRNKRR